MLCLCQRVVRFKCVTSVKYSKHRRKRISLTASVTPQPPHNPLTVSTPAGTLTLILTHIHPSFPSHWSHVQIFHCCL
jgi:hypothetical protein